MIFPVQVTWKHHDPSPAVEDYIREQADRLARFVSDGIDCSVTVDTPHHHKDSGNHYVVTVDLRTPGHEFVAHRDPSHADGHTDVHAAIKDAFESLKHQVQSHHGKRLDQQRHPRA